MNRRHIVALILTLAVAAANAAPLSAVVTCGMGGAPGQGCACDHGACCPDEAQGPALNARCCTVSLPDVPPVETAVTPLTSGDDLDGAALTETAGFLDGDLPDPERPSPAETDPPPDRSPPRYALFCTYLN